MQTENPPRDRIVRERERREITGLPTSSWYDLQKRGLAPRPVPIGVAARGWLLSELEAWVDARRAEREGNGWQSLGDAA
jgi:prophage regulatory protein